MQAHCYNYYDLFIFTIILNLGFRRDVDEICALYMVIRAWPDLSTKIIATYKCLHLNKMFHDNYFALFSLRFNVNDVSVRLISNTFR
jgi:hypothetical protein